MGLTFRELKSSRYQLMAVRSRPPTIRGLVFFGGYVIFLVVACVHPNRPDFRSSRKVSRVESCSLGDTLYLFDIVPDFYARFRFFFIELDLQPSTTCTVTSVARNYELLRLAVRIDPTPSYTLVLPILIFIISAHGAFWLPL